MHPATNKVWYLKKFPLFKDLDDEGIKQIAQFLEERNIGKMQIVFEPEDEDKAFFIKRGMVEVYQLTPDGKKIILDTLGPGSFFGAIGTNLPNNYFIESSEDTYFCVATRQRLFEMMTEKPQVASQLIEGLLEQLFEAREQIAVLATGNAKQKLLHLLKMLARKYGSNKGNSITIMSRFTHEEMAHMIGVSRETVTKTIGRLKRSGDIKQTKGLYQIESSLL